MTARPPLTPDAPPPVPEDIGDRLQARLANLERAARLGEEPRPPHHHDRLPVDHSHGEPPASDPSAGVADLNAQLDLLRHQLEDAFDGVDARIAAAHKVASDADARAQVASARAANVLAAVDELTDALAQIAADADAATTQRLRGAVDRLRARLLSA